MKMRKVLGATAAVLVVAFVTHTALAALTVAKTSTKTKGATTVSWNSSFHDLDYDGGVITLTKNDLGIVVNAGGKAKFKKFIAKKKTFTPPKDVDGDNLAYGTTFTVRVTSMHYDKKRDVYIANVHLKMRMKVDKSGDGKLDSRVDCGVNLHLERAGP